VSPWRWLVRALGIRTGGLYLLIIRHDHGCPRLRGGNCTCERVVEELHDITDDLTAAARFLKM